MIAADVFVYIHFLNNETNVNLCHQDLCMYFGNSLKNFDCVNIQKYNLRHWKIGNIERH